MVWLRDLVMKASSSGEAPAATEMFELLVKSANAGLELVAVPGSNAAHKPLAQPATIMTMLMAAGPAAPPRAPAPTAAGGASAARTLPLPGEAHVGEKRARPADADAATYPAAAAFQPRADDGDRATKMARLQEQQRQQQQQQQPLGQARAAGIVSPDADSGGWDDADIFREVANPISSSGQPPVSLAIIIPFRDQPQQNRAEQLRRFVDYMPRFLDSVRPPLANYHVFVIEQTHDGYKFNRGKTLNIGFAIAADAANLAKHGIGGPPFNASCFHDVDLIPDARLGPWYGAYPARPLHIGASWTRYPYAKYVGGVLTLSEAHARAINGFPNMYWGWGGEDDELFSRMQRHGVLPFFKPDATFRGALTDLEDELIRIKGGVRAGWRVREGGDTDFRCMQRKELKEARKASGAAAFATSGISDLDYALVSTRKLGPRATVFTVDLRAAADPYAEKITKPALAAPPSAAHSSVHTSAAPQNGH